MKDHRTKVCLFLRVSSDDQEYERQITELKDYCEVRGFEAVRIIATKVSGEKKNQDRKDIALLTEAADHGEFQKVVITEISRIGRKAHEIRNLINYLHERKIPLVLKNLGGIETLDEHGEETFVGNLIIAVHAEQAQEEKRLLRQRIVSGLDHARAQGKHIGRPHGKGSPEQVLKKYPGLVRDLRAGLSVRKSMKVHGMAMMTVVKVKRILDGLTKMG